MRYCMYVYGVSIRNRHFYSYSLSTITVTDRSLFDSGVSRPPDTVGSIQAARSGDDQGICVDVVTEQSNINVIARVGWDKQRVVG